jgi:hypothetical protein
VRRLPWGRLLGCAVGLVALVAAGTWAWVARPGADAAARHAALRVTAPARRGAIPDFSHVFLVVLENLGARQALALPHVAALAHRFAVATDYYAVAHPSLPNYLALASGSTWGVTSDCWYCYVPGPDLASELARAGITWGAYMEGLPRPCWLGAWWPPGDYAGKHDPFRYFLDVRDQPSLCAHIRPLSDLLPLLGGPPGRVPRFVWITPNLCHDGHDCPAAEADRWLGAFVPRILASAAWRQGGVLFVTWDESNASNAGCCGAGGPAGGGGGRVLLLVAARGLPPGLRVSVPYNHYSLLRTVEQAWGLPLLGQTARPGVQPLSAFWEARRGAARRARA